MRTVFEQENASFSDRAHLAAQEQIYPYVFNPFHTRAQANDWIRFETTSLDRGEQQRILDGEMATDRIVSVASIWIRAPLRFFVQERFRRHHFAKYQDITITEWNNASNQPSELYKLPGSGLFVYGYFNESENVFLDWIVLNTAKLTLAIFTGELECDTNRNRKGQDFKTIQFHALRDCGIVVAEKRDNKIITTLKARTKPCPFHHRLTEATA